MQRRPSNHGLRRLVQAWEPVDLPRIIGEGKGSPSGFSVLGGLGKSDLGDSPRMLAMEVYYVTEYLNDWVVGGIQLLFSFSIHFRLHEIHCWG
jgi:hypothetical protein